MMLLNRFPGGRRIHNPSSIPLWVSVDGVPAEGLPGTTLEA